MKIKYSLLIALIFICNYSKAQYEILWNFSATSNAFPKGSLVSDGTFLYGLTQGGGIVDSGVVFKIKLDGSEYSEIFDFGGANGSLPYEATLYYESGFLYGNAHFGGGSSNCNLGCGVLFKLKTDGSGYTKILDFDGTLRGGQPRGGFISDGTYLYGLTAYGGISDLGVIYKVKPNGTGYVNLHSFGAGTDGKYPGGTLIYDGTFLYGMTSQGGANGKGIIYRIKPDGTEYSVLLDFDGLLYGSEPEGSLIYDGAFLYAMTAGGGANNQGVAFKIKTDGNGFSKFLDFESDSSGANPLSNLTAYGDLFYGVTAKGGYFNKGLVFKIGKDGTNYSKVFEFTGSSSGDLPWGSLFLEGTTLYGMTSVGGINNTGTIYKIDLPSTTAIDEQEMDSSSSISVFPNPLSMQTNVQISKNLEDATITLYNALGEIVREIKNVSQKNISIKRENLPNGVYLITINQSGKIITTKKVIIED